MIIIIGTILKKSVSIRNENVDDVTGGFVDGVNSHISRKVICGRGGSSGGGGGCVNGDDGSIVGDNDDFYIGDDDDDYVVSDDDDYGAGGDSDEDQNDCERLYM